MASFNKFNQFTVDLGNSVHDFTNDTLKVVLTNTAPTASNAVLADITDLSTSGGYTAGGATATLTSWSGSGGVAKLVLADVVFTATTGFGPFRYAVLYNSTPTSPLKPLIGWWDNGSSVTLGASETFTVDYDASTGVLTIT